MTAQTFERLGWDSDFFGFEVARITSGAVTLLALSSALTAAANANVRLAYWSCDPADALANEAADSCGGTLVDRKCVYARNVPPLSPMVLRSRDDAALSDTDVESLYDLALQSGEFSRFKVDPRMPPEAWSHLYRVWMQRSVAHEIADIVLVERTLGRIVGMITLAHQGGVGNIGLFGIDVAHRGHGLGRKLLDRALAWFHGAGCRRVTVATQGNNAGARHVYERAGFELEQLSHFYHFWIEQP